MKRTAVIFLIFLCTFSYPQNKIPEQWLTSFEKTEYRSTPCYEETVDYLRRVQDNSAYAKLFTFGRTPRGREMYYMVVSKDKAFTPAEVSLTGKPVIMICSGIHAGEIEGKDASMILLREMLITKEKEGLLDNIILVVIPVFNIDGHERRSRYNRINQNGPEEMGWRTTAQNLNLNRDWLKADAPEMQNMLKLYSEWIPDFYIDSHTTDGADYQYVITYGTEKFSNLDDATSVWIKNKFIPFFESALNSKGFLTAPYSGYKGDDISKGIVDWVSPARFSTGYAADQNRPSLLIETHMLKPYKDRVYGTKEAFETALQFFNSNAVELKELNKKADKNTINNYGRDKKYFPLSFTGTENSVPFIYKGIESEKDSSTISGSAKITYTGKPFELQIPYYNENIVSDSVVIPSAYIIPPEWSFLAERLSLHGVKMEKLEKTQRFNSLRFSFTDVKFAPGPYESHQTITYKYTTYDEETEVPAGSYLVYTNQRTLKIIVHLLDPRSEESFLRWGFLNSIFERKEYFEEYIMEETAAGMIRKDPQLLKDFNEKLAADEEFRKNPHARLNFFYERSPYFDKQWNSYPVLLIY